ncbi:hypothetical protein GYMLUDRAFT_44446 [Collybiopsis luxurians FD-317 M1]|uniref:Uncharacterized protein n=1 Tax=Collybiopsis luxurians FD-317 M1 TaxID=944289 RepID=A0A0D0CAI6_9AGAR|nr:hypothetical protein GYMLUDRAFT_44446 [Collybiopsis luxurians FD-317 M1]
MSITSSSLVALFQHHHSDHGLLTIGQASKNLSVPVAASSHSDLLSLAASDVPILSGKIAGLYNFLAP